MNCSKVHELMSLYVDEQLLFEDKRIFEEHIQSCSTCEEELKLFKMMITDLNNLNIEKELPSDFHENLMGKIDALKPERNKSLLNDFRKWYPSVAAAFIIVIVFGVIGISNLDKYSNNESMDKMSAPKYEESKEMTTSEDDGTAYSLEQPKLAQSEIMADEEKTQFKAETKMDESAKENKTIETADEVEVAEPQITLTEENRSAIEFTNEIPVSDSDTQDVKKELSKSSEKNITFNKAQNDDNETIKENVEENDFSYLLMGVIIVIIIAGIALVFSLKRNKN